jgi:hypothetical protein
MAERTSMSGGANPAIVGGPSAGGQSVFAGQSEAGAGRVTGSANSAETGQSDQAGKPKGNLGPSTAGGGSPPNGGLARVFAGQSEAGAGRVTGGANSAETGQSDQTGQPKGKLGATQTTDNLPHWTEQLPKKLASDPQLAASLQGFKSLEDFVQAYLNASAKAGGGELFALPGQGASAQEIQAFYERLGKPKEAESYGFAKSDPDFAKVAFNANLTNAQADALYKAGLAQSDDARNLAKAQLAEDFKASDVLLQKEFGEKYEEAIALMQRGLGNNPATGQISGIAQSLMDAGLAGKPEIVRAFIEPGRAVSEGAASGGGFRAGQPGSVMEGRGFNYKDDYSKE